MTPDRMAELASDRVTRQRSTAADLLAGCLRGATCWPGYEEASAP